MIKANHKMAAKAERVQNGRPFCGRSGSFGGIFGIGRLSDAIETAVVVVDTASPCYIGN